MAKKTLTPEQAEIKAMKKEKSSQNWTKFWAIVLAAALTIGVVAMGQNQAKKAIDAATENSQSENVDNNDAVNNDDNGDMFGSTDNSTPSGDNNSTPSGDNNSTPSGDNNSTPSGDNNSTPSGGNQQSAQMTKADAIKAVNEATAKAVKASYHWKRTGTFTKDIDLGSSLATSMVNGIITAVDPNATLNSVVGGFLGIGDKEADVVNGAAPEGMSEKYLLKAMTLTEADVASWKVDGNKYMIQVKNTASPNVGSAMDKATNDYITVEEVNTSIASLTDAISAKDSSTANYTSIAIVATIENGQLTNMTLSYNFSASLDLSIGFTGTGAAAIEATYSNFKY